MDEPDAQGGGDRPAVILKILDAYIFLREFLRGFRENRLFEKGAFLAYLVLVAFIPLLASFVHVYSLFYQNYEEQIRTIVTQVLPYQEDAWFAYFNEFLAQARSLGTLALIFCFAIAVNVFLSIEGTFNVIWGIAQRRRLADRLGSFTMVIFWGPIALGSWLRSITRWCGPAPSEGFSNSSSPRSSPSSPSRCCSKASPRSTCASSRRPSAGW